LTEENFIKNAHFYRGSDDLRTPGLGKSYYCYGQVAMTAATLQKILKSMNVDDVSPILPSSIFEFEKSVVETHNSIDRATGRVYEGALFEEEVVYGKWDFYFLVRVFDDSYEGKLRAVIGYYGDRGLGGNASTGKGSFIPFFMDDEGFLLSPPTISARIVLSLYVPSLEERRVMWDNRDLLNYSVVVRRGVTESQLVEERNKWKPSVLMLEEGSVVPDFGKDIIGCYIPFEKDGVERAINGIALSVGVNL